MPRLLLRRLLVLGVIAAGSACSGSSTTTTTTPSPTAIDEPPFMGTLTQNGSAIQQFTTTNAGIVTVTIAVLTPDPPAPTGVALDLGSWDGVSCTVQIETPNADVGSTTTGTVTGAGTLCARIADAAGTLTGPVQFTLNIVHF